MPCTWIADHIEAATITRAAKYSVGSLAVMYNPNLNLNSLRLASRWLHGDKVNVRAYGEIVGTDG